MAHFKRPKNISAPACGSPHQSRLTARGKKPLSRLSTVILCSAAALAIWAAWGGITKIIDRTVVQKSVENTLGYAIGPVNDAIDRHYMTDVERIPALPGLRAVEKSVLMEDRLLPDRKSLKDWMESYSDYFEKRGKLNAFLSQKHADPVAQGNVDDFNAIVKELKKIPDLETKAKAIAAYIAMNYKTSTELIDIALSRNPQFPKGFESNSWVNSIQDILKGGPDGRVVCTGKAALAAELFERSASPGCEVFFVGGQAFDPKRLRNIGHATLLINTKDGNFILDASRNYEDKDVKDVSLLSHFYSIGEQSVWRTSEYLAPKGPFELHQIMSMDEKTATFVEDPAASGKDLALKDAFSSVSKEGGPVEKIFFISATRYLKNGRPCLETSVSDKRLGKTLDETLSNLPNGDRKNLENKIKSARMAHRPAPNDPPGKKPERPQNTGKKHGASYQPGKG